MLQKKQPLQVLMLKRTISMIVPTKQVSDNETIKPDSNWLPLDVAPENEVKMRTTKVY